jgi:hypothetical protein
MKANIAVEKKYLSLGGSIEIYAANGREIPNALVEIDPALPSGADGKLFVDLEKLAAWDKEVAEKAAAKAAGLEAKNAAYRARPRLRTFNQYEEQN